MRGFGERTVFFGHEQAISAAVEAETAHLAAAAARSRDGEVCGDQSFPEDVFSLSPPRVSAPPLLLIGGMGPQAGLRAFAAACRRGASSRRIVLVQACSVPDRTLAIGLERSGGRPARDARARIATGLTTAIERAWHAADRPDRADVIVLCNTAHHFLGDVRLPPGLRPISLIESAVRRCGGLPAVVVLATEGTRACGLYARSLARHDVACLHPLADEQTAITDLVYRGVKAGRPDRAEVGLRALLLALAQRVPQAGALLCGCTEIPLLLPLIRDVARPWPLIDPLACALIDLDGMRPSENNAASASAPSTRIRDGTATDTRRRHAGLPGDGSPPSSKWGGAPCCLSSTSDAPPFARRSTTVPPAPSGA